MSNNTCLQNWSKKVTCLDPLDPSKQRSHYRGSKAFTFPSFLRNDPNMLSKCIQRGIQFVPYLCQKEFLKNVTKTVHEK